MSPRYKIMAIWCMAYVCSAALAQAPAPARGEDGGYAAISRQLSSANPEQWAAAAASIGQLLRSDRWEVRDPASMRLMGDWMPKLLQAKAYELAAGLALEATLAIPGEMDRLEVFQTQRVEALLKAGRANEALAAAKSLHNVSGMGYTRDALKLVADALAAAYPQDEGIRRRFLEEQVRGLGPSTRPYDPKAAPASRPALILSAVKVDPAPYEPALKRESGEGFGALTARGNLLLLADRPQEAKAAFEKAYAFAPDEKLAYATENLARAIKAIDGTVGRANAFVLSVRPKDK